MGYVLAIDLGTTNVAAAVLHEGDRQPVIVELGDRTATMPSTVFMLPDGTFVVGEAAERRARVDPDRVARGFKRRLGDPVPMLLGGAPVGPAALLAALARHVMATVEGREGAPATRVALTHPANWGDWKLEQLRQVAALCHLDDVAFVSEPEAAAVHFAHRDRVAAGDTVAIYDLGGGTFDATVLRNSGQSYDVLGEPTGIEQLGGMDFDEALLAHVLQLEGVSRGDLDGSDPHLQRQLQTLRARCAAAKEILTVETEAVVEVEIRDRRADVRVTRREFEALIEPAVALTMDTLLQAVHSAGVDIETLGRVLLAGGSSRIPLVAELVSRRTHRPTVLDTHPKHTVALGAALVAGNRMSNRQAGPTTVVGSTGPAPEPSPSSAPLPPPMPTPSGAPGGAPPLPAPTGNFAPPIGPPLAAVPAAQARPMFVPTAHPRGSKVQRWPLIAALIGVLGLVAGAGAVLLTRSSDAGAVEVFAEPAATPGPNPFTPNTTTPDVPTTTAPTATTAPTTSTPPPASTSTPGAIAPQAGDSVGLYGGSLDIAVCDKQKLVDFLTGPANEPKARAWAEAQDISPAQIAPFVASLTPVVLRQDIRVTNNGFNETTASPTPRQSILERGTAVLVDKFGQPRVRCYCGNPLGAPVAVRPKLAGDRWSGLDLATVTRIIPAAKPITQFVVIDLNSGARITIPAETEISSPTTVSSTTAPTVTTTPPTTPTTTPPPTLPSTSTSTAPAASVDLTELGTVNASSTFGGGTYPPFLAVDGDPTTSWFSAGPQGGFSSFTFSLGSARTITRIGMESNAANGNPQFRRNFGFELVTIDVMNNGATTFSQQFSLAGTPDPNINIDLNALGDQIRLTFGGSEDPGCGGFAELTVLGR